MTLLFGHPTGNPNSHHAALAHFEAGWLEAFCVPWMPSATALRAMEAAGPVLRPAARRFSRRRFPRLEEAPLRQGRMGEAIRLALRFAGLGDERLSYQANDWLMRTMAAEARRPAVTAVHAYEDCSLWQFQAAKRMGKACIYDMPIGYYDAWSRTQAELAQRFSDWLPPGGLATARHARPEQKREEMALADLVLAPSSFVEHTIQAFHSGKPVARAAYGVDVAFWSPGPPRGESGPLRFIYAGQASLRKGTPDLLLAWEAAALPDAELLLVGAWQLKDDIVLPRGVSHVPPCSPTALRAHYRASDAFVFPSYFEGYGLVLLEAMACGLPAIASTATAAPDVLTQASGRIVEVGDRDGLVGQLRWASEHRDALPAMGRAARAQAETSTWEAYRATVRDAVAAHV
jgi:glycosyltransferase involved in cell wall biosynthesis